MNRATSHPPRNEGVTSGPTPTSKARLPAAYSTRDRCEEVGLLAANRSTKTSPSTSTLKFLFVIPHPARRPSPAGRPQPFDGGASCVHKPGSYLLEWRVTETELAALRTKYVHGESPARTPSRSIGPRVQSSGRQRQALRRLRRGIGVMNVGHAHPRVMQACRSSSSAPRTPLSRSCTTSRTSAWPATVRGRAIEGPKKAIFFRRRRGNRERGQDRSARPAARP